LSTNNSGRIAEWPTSTCRPTTNIGRSALDAQRELARQGRHRAVGLPDLLTAVLAAVHGLTVVHYDADFETAATVVAFEQVWVAQRGSL